MHYDSLSLRGVFGVSARGCADHGPVSRVGYDSRLVVSGPGTLFFAFVGGQHDAHYYVPWLYHERGIRVFVVSRLCESFLDLDSASFYVVPDVLVALQSLAEYHRGCIVGPVLGITGSHGKTIVKEWLVQLLQLCGYGGFHHSPQSYNSQLGVALSILGYRAGEHVGGIYEAGISQPGEMGRLARMIRPSIGLITNVGSAHEANFFSAQQLCQEKMVLFGGADRLIVNVDQPLVYQEAQQLSRMRGVDLVTWSRVGGRAADLIVEVHGDQVVRGRVPFTAHYQGSRYTGLAPSSDSASVENAVHALLAACELGVPVESAIQALHDLQDVPMRMERRTGRNGRALVNDSYSLDPVSLMSGLDFLERQSGSGPRGVILSDLPAGHTNAADRYSQIANILRERGVDLVAGVGPELTSHRDLFSGDALFYPDTDAFLSEFPSSAVGGRALLVKGGRRFHFERITQFLESRQHRTVMEINLNHVESNLRAYRGLLRGGVRLLVLVKAFAYGSGHRELAQLLEYHRVDYLGVAFVDEGVALRQAGIRLPILVLDPDPDAFVTMVRHELEPSIFSEENLVHFQDCVSAQGLSDYPVHLKIDTGMHRVGFSGDGLDRVVELLGSRAGLLRVRSVFTHLSCADMPGEDDYTLGQLREFEAACRYLSGRLGDPFLRHALNTAGLERLDGKYQYEMVRLGIGLHGVPGSAEGKEKVALQASAKLRSYVIGVKAYVAGSRIGYGGSGVLSRDSKIATVAIGYADGYPRCLGNGVGRVLVGGALVPTVGRICMDTCMVDVTGLDVKSGDEVVLFGSRPGLEEVAEWSGTIPYEVLSRVSARVPRVYVSE